MLPVSYPVVCENKKTAAGSELLEAAAVEFLHCFSHVRG